MLKRSNNIQNITQGMLPKLAILVISHLYVTFFIQPMTKKSFPVQNPVTHNRLLVKHTVVPMI